jgi:hypothetical protein
MWRPKSLRETLTSPTTIHAASGYQRFVGAPPDLIQLLEEIIVVLDVAQLIVVVIVLFERPVWRRRYDEVDSLRLEVDLPTVEAVELMAGG